VFFCDDVVYSKAKERIVFMEAAILTTILGTFDDLTPNANRDIRLAHAVFFASPVLLLGA
jgi:hypothetical protein